MPYQDISAELSAADVQAIKDAVALIREKLPFLQTLTGQDRVRLYKMGPQRLAWVDECLTAARNHPEVLPPTFKVAEFEKDYALAGTLAEVRSVLDGLAADVDDTTMGVGSEAARAASDVMGYIDAAAGTNPGLRTAAQSLHTFFQRANAASTKPAVAAK